MRHARKDYDLIQDGRPEGERIPEDEPVFLLRAQDPFATRVVEYWVFLTAAAGGDHDMLESVMRWVEVMEAWPLRKRVADVPADALRSSFGPLAEMKKSDALKLMDKLQDLANMVEEKSGEKMSPETHARLAFARALVEHLPDDEPENLDADAVAGTQENEQRA